MSFRSFLDNVFFTLKTIKLSDRLKFITSIFPYYAFGRESATENDLQSLIKAYRSWTYIYASKNAWTVASIPKTLYVAKSSHSTKLLQPTLQISKEKKEYFREQSSLSHYFKKAIDIEEVSEHPYLTMMKHVNPMMNEFDLGEVTQLYQELIGIAYWYVVNDENTGLPEEIWPLLSQHVTIELSKSNLIEKYICKIGMKNTEFSPEEVCMFRMINPNNPYIYGFSPLMAVLDAYNTSRSITKYEYDMFKNYGMPIGILTTEQPMPEEGEKKRIKEEWHSEYGTAGKIALLARGVSFQSITLPPRELAFLNGRKITQDELAEAYGQPEALRKATSLADKVAAKRSYREDTILPRLMRNQEKENEWLIPKYGDPTLFIAYNDPVPENKEFEMARRASDISAGITSINEERLLLGKEPVEGGDEPLISMGRIPLSMADIAGMLGGQAKNIDTIKVANEVVKLLFGLEKKK